MGITELILNYNLIAIKAQGKVACSAGVFFGRANVLLAKAPKRGENGASQKARGRGRGVRRENVYFFSPLFGNCS